jgi:hypothetical protein
VAVGIHLADRMAAIAKQAESGDDIDCMASW